MLCVGLHARTSAPPAHTRTHVHTLEMLVAEGTQTQCEPRSVLIIRSQRAHMLRLQNQQIKLPGGSEDPLI